MFKIVFAIGFACLCVQFVFAGNFEQECLAAHNKYRALHKDTPDLVLDSQLTSYAQQWANHIASIHTLMHNPENLYGENIFASQGYTNVKAEDAVKAWYDEMSMYDYGFPGFSSESGHFTQVVWKNSQRLGCAIATIGDSAFVVANYDPRGNYMNEFEENVKFPLIRRSNVSEVTTKAPRDNPNLFQQNILNNWLTSLVGNLSTQENLGKIHKNGSYSFGGNTVHYNIIEI